MASSVEFQQYLTSPELDKSLAKILDTKGGLRRDAIHTQEALSRNASVHAANFMCRGADGTALMKALRPLMEMLASPDAKYWRGYIKKYFQGCTARDARSNRDTSKSAARALLSRDAGAAAGAV